jgi:hypothetical protein
MRPIIEVDRIGKLYQLGGVAGLGLSHGFHERRKSIPPAKDAVPAKAMNPEHFGRCATFRSRSSRVKSSGWSAAMAPENPRY